MYAIYLTPNGNYTSYPTGVTYYQIQRSPVTSRMDRLKILPALPSEDSHQHGLMLAAYRDIGYDYAVDKGQLAKGLKALQGFESETVPLLKCVDHLDRVLAGCCWEVLITRKDPDDSHVGELFV